MIIKTQEEIQVIREASKILSKVLANLVAQVRPGITTKKLDQAAYEHIMQYPGAQPAFLNYNKYQHTICTSLNNCIVHGEPNNQYILKEGDLLSIDCGVKLKRKTSKGTITRYTDMAYTLIVGDLKKIKLGNNIKNALNLISVTKEALYKGIEQVSLGNTTEDIGYIMGNYVSKKGYTMAENLQGHGIGSNLHEPPSIPNTGRPKKGTPLQNGMVFCIEPIVNQGKPHTLHKQGAWPINTSDGQLSAHFEHTIAITEGKPEILTDYHQIQEIQQTYA